MLFLRAETRNHAILNTESERTPPKIKRFKRISKIWPFGRSPRARQIHRTNRKRFYPWQPCHESKLFNQDPWSLNAKLNPRKKEANRGTER